MKFNITTLAITVMACTAVASPEADAAPNRPLSNGLVDAYKMKRAAFDINDILKRHAEAMPSCSESDGICHKQRRALGDIAEVALDGYDEVSVREAAAAPKNKLPRAPEGKSVKHVENHCALADSNCLPKRSAAPESRLAKRSCSLCSPGNCPLWMKQACARIAQASASYKAAHPSYAHVTKTRLPKWCGSGGPFCEYGKRSISEEDVAQARPFSNAIREIGDTVQQIKRDVEAEDVEDDADDFYAEAASYFQELETRVNAAVAGLEE